jgi:hypothetical protein
MAVFETVHVQPCVLVVLREYNWRSTSYPKTRESIYVDVLICVNI